MNQETLFPQTYVDLVAEYQRQSVIANEQYPITMEAFRVLQETRELYLSAKTEEQAALQERVHTSQRDYRHQADLLSEKQASLTEIHRKALQELERMAPDLLALDCLRDHFNKQNNGANINDPKCNHPKQANALCTTSHSESTC
jgi:hypothetical protein